MWVLWTNSKGTNSTGYPRWITSLVNWHVQFCKFAKKWNCPTWISVRCWCLETQCMPMGLSETYWWWNTIKPPNYQTSQRIQVARPCFLMRTQCICTLDSPIAGETIPLISSSTIVFVNKLSTVHTMVLDVGGLGFARHWTKVGLATCQSPLRDITPLMYNGIGFLVVFGHVIDLLVIMVRRNESWVFCKSRFGNDSVMLYAIK